MKRVIVFMMLAVLLAGIVSAGAVEESISKIIDKVNNNSEYLKFIADLGYDSVRLSVGNESYFVIYKKGKVQFSENESYDIWIKMTDEEFENIIKAEESNDPKLKNMIMNKLPFMVKINLFFKCFGTNWCRKRLMG